MVVQIPSRAARAVAVALSLLALGLPGAGVAADADDVDRSRLAREIADDLMSPFCPGRTLYHCPSPNATQVKEEIRAWLAAGVAPEDIRSRLRARFGQALEARPGRGGQIAAGVVLALVALAFFVGLRRILRPAAPQPGGVLDPEVAARLSRELDGDDRT